MEPEEIDKLFKDRLAGLPTNPSPDAWLRLQQKMEPPKKERTMWLYYAAASISLLILAGLLFFRNAGPDQNQVALTPTQLPAAKNSDGISSPQATPTPNPASTSETVAQNNNPADTEEAENKIAAENKKPEIPVKKEKSYATVVKRKPAQLEKKNKLNIPTQPADEPATSVAQVIKTDSPDQKLNNAFTQKDKNTATENTVMVVVKFDNLENDAIENGEENSLRENIARKGSLLKNIYKQARNLKNGEPVELTALGVDTEKINAEKENIKLKINKVISL